MGGFAAGFAGGMGGGMQANNKKQQPDMAQPGLHTQQLGPYVAPPQAKSGVGQQAGATPNPLAGILNSRPAAQPAAAQPSTQPVPAAPGQPINTQTQQSGFHGVVPMIQNYYSNHQAKVQDSSATPHVQSLQDPSTTPEQRQYHIAQLQQIYANRPQVLQQMGISAPGGYNVPSVQPVNMPQPAQGSAQPPAVTPVNLGKVQSNNDMRVMSNPGEWAIQQ